MVSQRVTVLLFLLSLVAVSSVAPAQGDLANPGVIPPDAHYRGLTYGEWGASWWQAALAIPFMGGDNPLITGGTFGDEDGVLFLAAVFGAPIAVDVTIPTGTALFFPVVNAECSVAEPDPFHGVDEASLRACANGHIDQTSGLFAELDGEPVNNLLDYRTESPLFEYGPLPDDNILGLPAGTTSASVDAGVYLLLAPLSPGEHVVRFGGTFDEFGVSIDVTYVITVQP